MNQNNDRLTIVSIFLLGGCCIGFGSWLIRDGFQNGELLIANGAFAAIQGLIMHLTGRRAPTNTNDSTTVTTSPASNVTVTAPPETKPTTEL